MIYGSAGFGAIEVKNAARVRPEDLRGLQSFVADYPECEALLLYRGESRLRVNSVHCIPIEEFLTQLHPARGLTE